MGKVAARFVLEATYGIQTRQSLHLSEIARSLNEDIPLIKTVDRLSRQAKRKNLHETIGQFVAEQGAPYVKERTLQDFPQFSSYPEGRSSMSTKSGCGFLSASRRSKLKTCFKRPERISLIPSAIA